MAASIQLIALDKLVISERNVRKTAAEEGLDDLIASISAHGLLQSLVVEPAKRGKFAVIAGGRRLRALKALAKAAEIDSAYEVACTILEAADQAEEVSLAENIVRAPMHPADQFEAFCAVIDQGKTIADVAACFNVSEDLVQKRLKLGRLSAVLLSAYREDTIDLDQAQAFALSDDHAEQERVFTELSEQGLSPRRIRAALSHGEVPATDKRARFIGEEAHAAAGGSVRRDLFDDEDSYYLCDEALVERLVAEKLASVAETVKAEGWQWVSVDPAADYATLAAYERMQPETARLSKKAQKQLDRLARDYDAAVDAMSDDEDAEALAHLEELQHQIDALQPADTWPAETLAACGALISLNYDGTVDIERGLAKRTDAHKIGQRAEADYPASSPYSARLVENLTARRTAALRVELSRRRDVALAATVHALLVDACYPGTADSSLKLSLRTTLLPIGNQRCQADDAFTDIQAEWTERLPAEVEALWPWCLSQSTEALLELLAFLAASSFDAVRRKADRPDAPRLQHADQLAEVLNLDMTSWYRPTSVDFFAHISRKAILGAIDEATGTHGPALEKLKKADLAMRAAELVKDTGWLPEPMRIRRVADPSVERKTSA